MWDKITVGKFQQLHDIIAGQYSNALEKQLHLLACLEDKDPEYFETLPIQKYQEVAHKTDFLSIGDIPAVKAPRELVVDGTRYRVLYEFTMLTAGQFIDALNETKDQAEHIMRLHRILAAISVPVGKKYGDVPFDEVADAMLQVGILEAQAISLFFCAVWNKFLSDIPTYLAKRVRKQKKGQNWKQLAETLSRIGVGSDVPSA